MQENKNEKESGKRNEIDKKKKKEKITKKVVSIFNSFYEIFEKKNKKKIISFKLRSDMKNKKKLTGIV